MSEGSGTRLTVGETAAKLGVSERTVYAYMKEGKLTPIKEGRRVYLDAEEVQNLKTPPQRLQYDPEHQLIIDRKEYENLLQKHEGLLVRLGQLEAETRFMKEENQKLLEDKRFRDEGKRPWWKRIFGGERETC